MQDRRLAREIGRLLRLERERARLTQAALARRAGLAQQRVSQVETGRFAPTSAVVERLFDALGRQVRLDVEARDADLDAMIEAAADRGGDIELLLGDLEFLQRRASPPQYLLDGELAAAVLGVPIRPSRLELAIREEDLDAAAGWLLTVPNMTRYSERRRDFGDHDIDPRHPGPLRWMTPFGELRLRLLRSLPEPVVVRLEGRELRVRPLPDIELDCPGIARMLRRLRARSE